MTRDDFRRKADLVRAIPLEVVLISWDAVRDRRDKSQWRTLRGPLSVSGTKFYNWRACHGGGDRSPFKSDSGQQADDPPLTDVIVQGNTVQSIDKPRYDFAVIIGGGPNAPLGLHFSSNLFHPGNRGVANKDLPP